MDSLGRYEKGLPDHEEVVFDLRGASGSRDYAGRWNCTEWQHADLNYADELAKGGQILIVTDGVGWVQQWGGPVQVIRKGDVVWIPAGVKHWHGATPTTTMTHIAFQEQVDGTAVNWLEKVTDEQYRLMK